MKKINFFVLLVAIYTFVFSPILHSYVWAADTASNIHLEKAKELYDNLEYEEALKELKKAMEVPGNTYKDLSQIHQFFAYTYIALEQRGRALDEFKNALNYDPSLKVSPEFSSPKILDVFNRAKEEIIEIVDNEPPVIKHLPFEDKVIAGDDLNIHATILDNKEVVSATLLYKRKSRENFSKLNMIESEKSEYSATIPGTEVDEEGMVYFIEAVDASGNKATKGSGDLPLLVSVKEKSSDKPFYKKLWFWAIAVGAVAGIAGAGAGGGGGGGGSSKTGKVVVSGPAP